MKAKETRLHNEFKAMKALHTPYCLFNFYCADLSEREMRVFSQRNFSSDIIKEGWPGFLKPEEFERKYPGIPPQKYLIMYSCLGLERSSDDSIIERDEHVMEVIFGPRYPAEQPTFIWITPIWHPNFRNPYICIQGRPWAVGLTLAQITTEVGRMIQYQNYNVQDPLNHDAEAWARRHAHLFPVDNRDILDSRRIIGGQKKLSSPEEEPLFEIIDSEKELERELERASNFLVEIVEADNDKQK